MRRSLIAYLASAFAALGLAAATTRPAAASPPIINPEWTAPMAPFKIADDLYYVGSRDLTSYLIVTSGGLIVLDAGVEQNAPMVLANIRALGFDPHRIKILLNSHAHYDHAAGLAALKAASGARFFASAADAPVLESGGHGDFHFGDSLLFPAIKVDQVVHDGEKVTLGRTTITAHLTPGHTPGCTSWTLPVRVDGETRQALFICSLSILAGYKMVGDPKNPNLGADYAHTFDVLHALPCEVFLAAHGSMFGLVEKRAVMLKTPRPNPFVDPQGCRAFIADREADFHKLLDQQKAPSPH